MTYAASRALPVRGSILQETHVCLVMGEGGARERIATGLAGQGFAVSAYADAASFYANEHIVWPGARYRDIDHLQPSIFGKQQSFHHDWMVANQVTLKLRGHPAGAGHGT